MLIMVSILAIIIIFLRTVQLEMSSQKELFQSSGSRPTITFILGSDKDGQQYFSLAERHFLLDSSEKTDVVVKHCHSLQSVINYLNRNSEDAAWGVINLVAHGNMWGGLSVPMTEEGGRAYPKDLYHAVTSGLISAPEPTAIDPDTKINIWACGIGKNPILNMALELLFTNSNGEVPEIYASPHFVVFMEIPGHAIPVRIKASYWPYFFQRGYRPGELEIVKQLRQDYPDMAIDWESALKADRIDSGTSEFHEEFNVPVVWTVLYEDKESRPSVKTKSQQMQWIKSQPDLMHQIEDLQIPLDKYSWTVNKILYKHPDGSIQPAIKAIGMCTVVCVLSADKV